jgi:hemerythrin-like domain-containing protein
MNVPQLTSEHRTLEAALDLLAEAFRGDGDVLAAVRAAYGIAAHHYKEESQFLDWFAETYPALAGKIAQQHAEVGELAERIEESARAGLTRDVFSLARRFLALAQHNIIEEERDVFPLAARCIDPGP